MKYSSECSVPLCTSNTNSSCSSSTPCYSYQTSTNQIICAPKVDCSLFESCNAYGQCTSNTSVCVVNSCCCPSICMPLSLASTCSANINMNSTQNNSNIYSTPTSTTTVIIRNTTMEPFNMNSSMYEYILDEIFCKELDGFKIFSVLSERSCQPSNSLYM